MNINRVIVLVFSVRATMLGAGCGSARRRRAVLHGRWLRAVAGALPSGLYCDFESASCQPCDQAHCEAYSPPPYTPSTSPTATAPPDPTPECSLVTTPSVLCNDDEETFYYHPGASTAPVDSCRPATTQYYYCCGETTDAGEDANDGATDADVNDE